MPVSRFSLREQIKEMVIERILDGTYAPGERLVETQLAQELGTSQAPVREALRDLQAMRFVTSEPYRGTRVRAVSDEELAEIYPVRAALEELAGQLAAARLDERLLQQLRDELEEMRGCAARHDVHGQLSHDARFHELVVQGSGNGVLLEAWQSLRIEARALVSVIRSTDDLAAIAESHLPIIEALESADPRKAGQELRAHIEHFLDQLTGGARTAH